MESTTKPCTSDNGQTALNGACIFERKYSEITKTPISISKAPKYRYRLVDCKSFADRESLRILEFEDLPKHQYGAVSYVWRDLEPKKSIEYAIVDGTGGEGKFDVEVLHTICVAMLSLGCDYLWMDILSIMEESKDDISWQMQRMCDIYTFCKECLVVPGGIKRLADLSEETTWIHRAWTLQEAVAPPSTQCLFSWAGEDARLQTNMETPITVVQPGKAAVADMKSLLESSFKGWCSVLDKNDNVIRESLELKLLGKGPQLMALLGALDHKGTDGFQNAIWRSSFTRTAKYPADNVFSIMGILGVTLDTKKFDVNDRLSPTIALMQGLLAKGGRIEWLGIATKMPPNPQMSTIPAFTERSASTKRVVVSIEGQEQEVSDLMDGWWTIANTPQGQLDDSGYLTFKSRAVSISEHSAGSDRIYLGSADRYEWDISPKDEGEFRAVLVGTKEPYTNGVAPATMDPDDHILVIIREHQLNKFDVLGYVFVPEEKLNIKGWYEETFTIGGPNSAHKK
ncbi:ankyrin repeat-containing protein [Fusarium avenaceum]|nr:ankyrin repeat-containing protein [Fusarium avenaceum]